MSEKGSGLVSRTLGRLFGSSEKSSPSKDSSHNKPDAAGEVPGGKKEQPQDTRPYRCNFWTEDQVRDYSLAVDQPFSLTIKREKFRQSHKSKPVTIEVRKIERDIPQKSTRDRDKDSRNFVRGKREGYWGPEQLSMTFDDLRISVKGEFFIEATIWETRKWDGGLRHVHFGILRVW
ncbi:hypothetical protein F4814DRAFT_429032 [Daldinia grandis]|nr:hypothetical protein F4814DRAFT_429032 [Daldinia grandis]